jgi:4'-phosphopantetheinyl transferase
MLRVAIARIPDVPEADGDAPPGWMGDTERRRWTGLTSTSRREFTASRALLRRLLQEATGLTADAWDVSAEAGTAPVARTAWSDDDAGAPRASLSHRLGWVAAAVADGPIGIDLECRRPARSDPAERAALMLSPAELPAWQALTHDERESALLTRWVAKEAWFKASPPETALWDFRRVVARACAPEHANVRVWESPSLHLALCCADPQALGEACCEGLAVATSRSSSWHVHRVPSAT